MSSEKFSIKARIRSFRYAFRGICILVREEHNARIHTVAAMAAVAAGIWLGISATEWAVVAVCIAAVIAAEAVNSAVEALCDKVSPAYDPLIGKAKDLAAAAVLLTATGALAAGLIIFVPKLMALAGIGDLC